MSKNSFWAEGPTDRALRSWGFIGICLWVVIGAGVVAAGLGGVLSVLVTPLASFLIAGLIVVLARPGVRWLRKHGMGRGLSATIGALGSLLALILLVAFFLAPVVTGATQLLANAPAQTAKLSEQFNAVVAKFSALPPSAKASIQDSAKTLAADIGQFGKAVFSFFVGSLSSVFTVGLSIFMGLVLTFWFLLDGDKISAAMLSAVPSVWREDAREVTSAFNKSFSGYLIGTAINISVLFLLCGIGFTLVHLPGAWFLAAMLGVLDLIPFIGPLIGGAIATLVALTVSPTTALIVIVIVLVAEQFVDSFLSPVVMGKVVTMHPVAVIFALCVGIAVAGFFGAILAIPVAAAIHTVYRYYKYKGQPVPAAASVDIAPEET